MAPSVSVDVTNTRWVQAVPVSLLPLLSAADPEELASVGSLVTVETVLDAVVSIEDVVELMPSVASPQTHAS